VSGRYTPACLGQKDAALLGDETAQSRGVDEVAGTVAEQAQSGQSVAAFCIERGQRSAQFLRGRKGYHPE